MTEVHYCSYCDAARIPAPGYLCPECEAKLAGPLSLVDEVTLIERKKGAEFEAAGRKLLGPCFKAKYPT